MAGVTNGFVIELADLSDKSVRKCRSSAGCLESLELRETVEGQTFDLRHRFDFGDLAIANNACNFDVLIDQAFDRKNKLVIQRRLRILRKTADADVDLLDLI